MKRPLRAGAAGVLLVAFACTAHAAGECGVVTVGRSAPNNNCTVRSLKDALTKAKEECYQDIIWISNDVDDEFFPEGTVTIDDQNVEIVGGFADCDGFAGPSGYQLLSGAGGDSESVINIRGHSRVWLSHLEIAGGDEGINDDGGGIDFKGSGSLNLSHLHLVHNDAGYGGGMLLAGTGALQVTLGNDVVIADNVAERNGGGIHASGSVSITMRGDGLAFHRNRAKGLPTTAGTEDGQGGGIYVKAPARALIGASAFPTFSVFWQNRAYRGGAIAATGADGFFGIHGVVTLFSHQGQGPMTLESNRADATGGAVYLGAKSDENAFSFGEVCADDTGFRDNVAPQGAAVYVHPDDSLRGSQVQGRFTTNNCANSLPRCPAGMGCSAFENNRSEFANGNATDGAVIDMPGGGSGELWLHRTAFTDNVAGTLIHVGDDAGNRLELDNCLIARNTLSRYAIDTDANVSRLRHCTIADNTLGGTHVVRLVESSDAGGDSLSSLTNSIIAQPGKLVLRHEGATAQTVVGHLLTNDLSGLPAGERLVVGAAGFVDAPAGDYRLGPLSEALDNARTFVFNEAEDGFEKDLLGAPRTVDLPERDNLDGARDLGCCETASLPGIRVFADGFDAPLRSMPAY